MTRRMSLAGMLALVTAACGRRGATEADANREAPPTPPVMAPGLVVHQLTPMVGAACRALGVRDVRWTVYPGATDSVTLDTGLAVAADYGLRLLLCVHGGAPAGWLNMASHIARSTAGLCYQFGNEVDTPWFTDRFLGERGAREYSHFLRAAGDVVRGVDPTATLVASQLGGPGPAWYVLAMDQGDPLWRDAVDAVAVHAYGPPPHPAYGARVNSVRAVCDRPVWVTETGLSLGQAQEAWRTATQTFGVVQADATIRVLRAGADLAVPRTYLYALDGDDGFALRDEALSVLMRLARDGQLPLPTAPDALVLPTMLRA